MQARPQLLIMPFSTFSVIQVVQCHHHATCVLDWHLQTTQDVRELGQEIFLVFGAFIIIGHIVYSN